jgi:hypothetical protein
MAETTSNPDVLIAASCGLKSVRFGVRFCIRPAEHPMAGNVPKSTRLEASLRHGTEQLERYALLYIAGTSIFAPHQYLGAFPAHLFGVRDSSRHRERLAGSICC